jgi:hypothetical protein
LTSTTARAVIALDTLINATVAGIYQLDTRPTGNGSDHRRASSCSLQGTLGRVAWAVRRLRNRSKSLYAPMGMTRTVAVNNLRPLLAPESADELP